MRSIYKYLIAAIIISIIISLSIGCAAKLAPSSEPSISPSAPDSRKTADLYTTSEGGNQAVTIDRRIVRTGYITLVVKSIPESLENISNLATKLDGYVVSSNSWGTDSGARGQISIRIPAHKFDDAMFELRQMAVNVQSERTGSQDVTEEYIDLKARLHNLEATEAQYIALLQKAQTVEDILKVQKELSNVRGQIEQIKGRIQYLERTSDTSLIEINLQEEKTFQQNGWSAFETLKSAVRGLVGFSKVMASIIIWLLIFSPVWLIIIGIIFLIRRLLRRKKQLADSRQI